MIEHGLIDVFEVCVLLFFFFLNTTMLTSFFASRAWQVMTCLGLQMIVLGFVLAFFHWLEMRSARLRTLRLGPTFSAFGFDGFFSFAFTPTCLTLLGIACIASTQAVIHYLQHGDPVTAPQYVATSFAEGLARFLMVPGHVGSTHTVVVYPLVPWLGVSLFGCAFGFEFRNCAAAAHVRCLLLSIVFLAAFPLIRAFGGSALNLRGWPLYEHRDLGALSFFLVCKYPPSIAYLCLTLGVDLLLLFLADRMNPKWLFSKWVINYGTSPLVYYVSHFWIINLIALVIYLSIHQPGLPLQYYPIFWGLILLVEIPVCYFFGKFKTKKSPDSLWRLF
jgi:hypothetical protein